MHLQLSLLPALALVPLFLALGTAATPTPPRPKGDSVPSAGVGSGYVVLKGKDNWELNMRKASKDNAVNV